MKLVNNCIKVNLFGDKSNPAIIFIHGFPFDSSMWNNQISALENNYYVVTYDIRGLGKSYVGDGQYTMEAYVNDLFAVIEELDLEKPILCGLSMGGYIALRAIEKEQNKFKALILCDTKSEADDDKGKLKRAVGINKINVDGLSPFVEEFIPNCFYEKNITKLETLLNSLIKKASNNNPVGVKGSLLSMLSRTDTTEFLKEIKLPAAVICGTHDKLSSLESMKKLSQKISNSEFQEIPDAGHLSPLENPERFNKVLTDFLKKL